jgi:hypothetical protein
VKRGVSGVLKQGEFCVDHVKDAPAIFASRHRPPSLNELPPRVELRLGLLDAPVAPRRGNGRDQPGNPTDDGGSDVLRRDGKQVGRWCGGGHVATHVARSRREQLASFENAWEFFAT